MRAAVVALLDAGNNVILDEMRHLGNARGHYGYGMDGPFDLVLDAAILSPTERATAISTL